MKFSEGKITELKIVLLCHQLKKLSLKVDTFLAGNILSKIDVHNPVFDYIPPDLVNLCISNM